MRLLSIVNIVWQPFRQVRIILLIYVRLGVLIEMYKRTEWNGSCDYIEILICLKRLDTGHNAIYLY